MNLILNHMESGTPFQAIFHFWYGDSKSTPNIPNWLRDKFVPVFDLHATQAALNDPFRQCEKCGELVEFTDYQVHVERHTLSMKQCCGLTFRDFTLRRGWETETLRIN